MLRSRHAALVPMSRTLRTLFAVAIIAAAFAVRAIHIGDPILDFHPTRQYRSAIIARALYYTHAPVSAAERARADTHAAAQGAGEPPFMEWLAGVVFRLLGREALWVGRLLAACFWVAGAWPLYRLSGAISGAPGAIAALVIYLFGPFAIVASTSFQPDPLMVALITGSALACYRYGERPAFRLLLMAAALAGAAALIKPFAAFFTLGTFAFVVVGRRGFRALFTPAAAVFVALALAPVALYYGYAVVVSGTLRGQLSGRFMPTLLGTSFFWEGWLAQMRFVVGGPALVAALAGVALARPAAAGFVLLGLWTGYVAFALVSNYHVATHNYYSLPLVPIAALSVGALAARAAEWARQRVAPRPLALTAIVLLIGLLRVWTLQSREGPNSQRLRLDVHKYERIGRLVNHDAEALMLDPYYGYPLIYHGEVSGRVWPSGADLTAASLAGAPDVPAERRFAEAFAAFAPRYFIVTDLASYHGQPDLKSFLEARFARLADDYNFIIFDLDRPLSPRRSP